MSMEELNFPELVRVMRKSNGMSQTELANHLSTLGHDWHQNTVSRIELGIQEPTLRQAFDLDAGIGLGLFNFEDGYEAGFRAGIVKARNALESL